MPRDVTKSQFDNAIKRNGFRPVGAGIFEGLYWEDTTGEAPGVHLGAITTGNGRIDRRATLAHLLRGRKRHAGQPCCIHCGKPLSGHSIISGSCPNGQTQYTTTMAV